MTAAELKSRLDVAAYRTLLAPHLQNVKWSGDAKGKCRCLQADRHTNDDAHPSMSLDFACNGRAKCSPLYCPVCSKGWDIFDALKAIYNCDFAEARRMVAEALGVPAAPSNGRAAKKRGKTYATAESLIDTIAKRLPARHSRTWTYHNADGSESFRVARFDSANGKTFRPFFKAADGWREGDPPGLLPLYRLPRLGNSERAYVFEGEGCVETAESIGLAPATTSAHGAKAAAKTDWAPLAGCEAIIMPDPDDAGEAYARDVTKILLSLDPPARVRIVTLPGLPAGGDIVEYIAARECQETDDIRRGIEALVERTPPVTKADALRGPITAMVPISALGVAEPIDWLWDGYLAPGGITLLSSLWKVGKTTLVAWLLRLMESGGSLITQVRSCRVGVVSEESPSLWIERREELGLGDHVHILARPFGSKPTHDEWIRLIEYLVAYAAEHDLAAIVFDPLANLLPLSDENDAAAMMRALMPLHELAKAGVAVLLLHHFRKGDGTEGQAARGSGALGGFVDVILELRRVPGDPNSPRRVLTGYSRHDETPREVVIELTDDGYRNVGTPEEAERTALFEAIATVLPTEGEGLTQTEIRNELTERLEISIKITRLKSTMRQGLDLGMWDRSGTGKRNDPYRYVAEIHGLGRDISQE